MRPGRTRVAILAAVCGLSLSGLPIMADVVTTRIGPDGSTYTLLASPNPGGWFDGLTWSAAETEAVALGGHLATINSAREDAWVYRTFSPYRSDLWIGLNAVAIPGAFVWSSGQPVTYTNWAPGEPNPDPNGRYAHQWGAQVGKWRAGFSGEDFAFGVAEIPNAGGVFQWKSSSGGIFGTGTNWLPAGPPPALGAAIFDQPGTFPVTFAASMTNAVATVEQGNPIFNLGGNTYTLTEMYIGATSGKNATVLLTGTGSAKIQTAHLTLGDAANSTGTLTVSGGTSVAAATDMVIGNSGTGMFNVPAGGVANTARAYVGNSPGGTGYVTLSGANAQLTTTDIAAIGWHGTGSLQVKTGGRLSAAGLDVAEWEDATGSVVVDGAGSAVNSTSGIGVGLRGTGTLTVSGGATLHAITSGTTLGQWGTLSSGTAVVTGAGSSWITDYGMNVGNDGRGDLRVEAGGSVTAHDISIGAGSFSSGVVRVTGIGSHLGLLDSGGFNIGGEGTGSLTIDNQGDVSGGDMQIGAGVNSTGTVIVSGAGSKLRPGGGIRVGAAGNGSLSLSAGAALPAVWMELGGDAGSYGAGSFSGAGTSATFQADVNVGSSGTGVLAISDGAQMTVTSWFRAGFQPGANGQISVSGTGTTVSNPGEMVVGEQGTGTLTIENSGTVNVANNVHVGAWTTGVGQLKVSGAGSSLAVGGSIRIAEAGTGSLVVDGGAAVTAAQEVLLADSPGAVGSLTVSGVGSHLTANADMRVGRAGSGTLTIDSGGSVSNTWARVGHEDPAASGLVTVSGQGSTWTCSGDLIIGELGTGSVRILSGGHASSIGDTQLGPNSASTGSLLVSGPGSKYTVHGGVINAWRGSITAADGGVIEVSDAYVYIGNGATATLAGGTINARDGFWSEDPVAPISGFGTITGFARGRFPIVARGGKLVMGDATRTDGFGVEGNATVETNATLELLDKDYAGFWGPHTVTLTNGVIIARNGLHIDGDPNGLTGYGIVVGACDRFISAPSGRVNMTQTLDVGSAVAKVYSAGIADLGTVTTISGGQLGAAGGLRVGADDLLSGFGTVAASISLQNGVIAADPGKTLTIAGALSGFGMTVGDVNPFISSIASPTGTVALGKGIDVGDRSARVYSLPGASLGPTTTLAGGSITAANGLALSTGQQISGHGVINANVTLASGTLRGDGGVLAVNGTVRGHGLLVDGVTATTMLPADGIVEISQPMNFGASVVTVYANGPSTLSSTLTLDATSLVCDRGLNIGPSGLLQGAGAISGEVVNNGEIRSTTGPIVFSGPVQNLGKIAGDQIGFGATGSFTGGGTIAAYVSSNPGSTITATSDLTLGKTTNYGGVSLHGNLAVGPHTVTLLSSSVCEVGGTTTINGGLLSVPPALHNTGFIIMSGSNSAISTSELTNTGTIQGHGTITSDYIENNHLMTFSGVSDVVGQVNNNAQITVTGGGPTTFFTHVSNAGNIKISEASIAVFLDGVSTTGAGAFSGTGTKIIEGGTSAMAAVITPGNTIVQPAAMVSADVFRENALTVRGVVTINPNGGPDGTSSLNMLQIDPGGVLNLKDNDLVLHGRSYETVRQWILDHRLTTTAGSPSPIHPAVLAPVDNNLLHAIDWNGVPVSDGSTFNQLMVKYTYLGDVNLDGQVTAADLNNVFAHMGQPGTWFDGDVDLDGLVTLADFDAVRQNLGAGVPSAGGGAPLLSSYTVVPEPGVLTLMIAASLGLLRRGKQPQ